MIEGYDVREKYEQIGEIEQTEQEIEIQSKIRRLFIKYSKEQNFGGIMGVFTGKHKPSNASIVKGIESAVLYGNMNILQLFLYHYQPPCVKNASRFSAQGADRCLDGYFAALYVAARRGDLPIFELLLSHENHNRAIDQPNEFAITIFSAAFKFAVIDPSKKSDENHRRENDLHYTVAEFLLAKYEDKISTEALEFCIEKIAKRKQELKSESSYNLDGTLKKIDAILAFIQSCLSARITDSCNKIAMQFEELSEQVTFMDLDMLDFPSDPQDIVSFSSKPVNKIGKRGRELFEDLRLPPEELLAELKSHPVKEKEKTIVQIPNFVYDEDTKLKEVMDQYKCTMEDALAILAAMSEDNRSTKKRRLN